MDGERERETERQKDKDRQTETEIEKKMTDGAARSLLGSPSSVALKSPELCIAGTEQEAVIFYM